MALGEENDFRTKSFQQVMRFPPQDRVGGTGSPFPMSFTTPSGSSNMSSPVSPLSLPGLTLPNITFPAINLPNQIPPVVMQPISTGGTNGSNGITVEDLATPGAPASGVTLLQFDGYVNVDTSTPGTAKVNITSGAGPGSTLVYGQITAASKGTYASWTYTVQKYVGGASSGAPFTAKNLVEFNNGATLAYGYSITGAGYDKIVGTSYYIKSVPVGTWVRMEYTNALPGGYQYWFEAPNRIDGGC
jgi:hypothetical protein